MTAETLERMITRVQIKSILQRQAQIKPGETMFDGVMPLSPAGYALQAGPVLSCSDLAARVRALESWIDSNPNPTGNVSD